MFLCFGIEFLQNSQFNNVVELNNNEPNGVLGISIYENPKEIYYYIATATDQKTPCDMHEYHIPASTWAVFENDGYIKEDVQSVFRRFYTEWLPFSGYDYAGLPDIEVYPIQNGKNPTRTFRSLDCSKTKKKRSKNYEL